MPQSPLNHLLNTKMDRKQFIARSGAMVMALTGITGIIKSLTLEETKHASGYGSSPYGGGLNRILLVGSTCEPPPHTRTRRR